MPGYHTVLEVSHPVAFAIWVGDFFVWKKFRFVLRFLGKIGVLGLISCVKWCKLDEIGMTGNQ